MANNRLYIRCKGCRGYMSWAKFYPSDDGIGWYTNTNSDEFNTFFNEHGPHNKMTGDGSFWDLMDENDDRVKLYDFEHRVIEMEGDGTTA